MLISAVKLDILTRALLGIDSKFKVEQDLVLLHGLHSPPAEVAA